MARVDITPSVIARTSVAVTPYATFTADGIKFKNTGKEFIIVKRAVASTATITIHTNVTVDGLALPDLTVALVAGDSTPQEKIVGPFPTQQYNQANGEVWVDSSTTADTIAVCKITPAN